MDCPSLASQAPTVSLGDNNLRDLAPANSGLVRHIPSKISMNTCRPASTNASAHAFIQLSHFDSTLTQTSNWQRSAVSLVSQQPVDRQSPLPPHPSGSRTPPSPQQPQIILSATHRIRLIPHIDSDDFFWFDPISRDVEEGDSPLKIGRLSFRDGPDELSFKSQVVSRAHAEIWTETGGKFFIRDTKSATGTFLNHLRLSPAGVMSRPFDLRNGDVLQLGVTHQDGTEDIHKCVKIKVEIE